MYVAENVIYIYRGSMHDEPDPVFVLTARVLALMLPMYSLIMAIVDYKSKISLALNLEAIESKLKSYKVPVGGQGSFKAFVWGLMIIHFIAQLWGFLANVLGFQDQLSITRFITTFQIIGTQLVEGFYPLLFLAKMLILQKAIKNDLYEVNQNVKGPSTARGQRLRNRGIVRAQMQTDAEQKWALLTELQGCLFNVEAKIRETTEIQLILSRILVEIFGPILFLTMTKFHLLAMRGDSLPRVILSFLSTVYIAERLNNAKKEALMTLSKEIVNDGVVRKKLIKRQILAGIHRSRAQYSCSLFDVNYGLLIVVLENMLLVATSMIGNS